VRVILVESPDRFARDLNVQITGHDYLRSLGVELVPASALGRCVPFDLAVRGVLASPLRRNGPGSIVRRPRLFDDARAVAEVQRSAVKHQFKRIAVAVAASREGHRLRGSDREGQRRRWGRGQKPTVVQGGRNNSWR
jgi:hypothetical protein